MIRLLWGAELARVEGLERDKRQILDELGKANHANRDHLEMVRVYREDATRRDITEKALRHELRVLRRRLRLALERADAAGAPLWTKAQREEQAEYDDAWTSIQRAIDDMIPESQRRARETTAEWARRELRRKGPKHAEAIAQRVRDGEGDADTDDGERDDEE